MSKDDLTPVQRSALLVLMAEARDVPNADLTNIYGLEIKADRRQDLHDRGLIKAWTVNRRVFMRLEAGGRRWCQQQLGADVPAGAGHGGAAAYALLEGIRRYLDQHKLDLKDFFDRSVADEPELDVEAQIRKAYEAVAPKSGAWVKLADIRSRLGSSFGKDQVDDALTEMSVLADVNIVPESNQKTLTKQDRDASVRIGNQEKHLIRIGRP